MQEEEEKRSITKMVKQDQQALTNNAKQDYYDKVRNEVQMRRAELNEQKEYLEIQRQQEVLKATSIKQMIRNQEIEAEEKRRYMEAQKKAQARQQFEQKVLRENQMRMTHEQMVS